MYCHVFGGLVNPIFRHLSARSHITKVTEKFLEEAQVHELIWPDHLSTIEHVWDMIGTRLGDSTRRQCQYLHFHIQEA